MVSFGTAPVRARRNAKSPTWIGLVHVTLLPITAVGCAPRPPAWAASPPTASGVMAPSWREKELGEERRGNFASGARGHPTPALRARPPPAGFSPPARVALL